ncbi:MAG: alpha/beta fold hydrolase [Pseudobdellovibrionaceae bacterium]
MKLWALHGFLGQASDFVDLQQKCTGHDPSLDWHSVDYMHSRELSPQSTLEEWGNHFCKLVGKSNSKENVLLGYSQGGRLALQALKNNSSLWKAVILLSTNPGLTLTERPARLKNDEEWAEKFLNHNFQKSVEKWNSQAIFQGSVIEPERREENYNRRQLADCLTRWSLANQEDFRSFLRRTSVPTLYISGERDTKYSQIGHALAALRPTIIHKSILNAGHRVFLDQPDAVSFEIIKFLKDLSPSG